jgi:hypothetical protein
MIGSERLRRSFRATEAPFERSLALTKMTQRMRAIFEGLRCFAFALAQVLRCECEKSFHERVPTTGANSIDAPARTGYPFGPTLP